MALDPYVNPDPEIQALLQLTGVRAWKLWRSDSKPGEVYLTLRIGNVQDSTKIMNDAPVATWRATISDLLDKVRE